MRDAEIRRTGLGKQGARIIFHDEGREKEDDQRRRNRQRIGQRSIGGWLYWRRAVGRILFIDNFPVIVRKVFNEKEKSGRNTKKTLWPFQNAISSVYFRRIKVPYI